MEPDKQPIPASDPASSHPPVPQLNSQPPVSPPVVIQGSAATAVSVHKPAETTCPKCHQPVMEADYFCKNCGENLKPVPPATSWEAQLTLYTKSVLLPPLGIIWGWRYLRQSETKAKLIGVAAIGLTLVVLWLVMVSTIRVVNSVNQQVNDQLNQMMF